MDQVDYDDKRYFIKVPQDTVPIFGDQFSESHSKDKDVLNKVYQFDGEDYLLRAASKHMNKFDFLDLNEIDCIYGSKFGMMIKEAFRDDKHFIFARLKSRGIDKFENEEGKEEVNYDSFIK